MLSIRVFCFPLCFFSSDKKHQKNRVVVGLGCPVAVTSNQNARSLKYKDSTRTSRKKRKKKKLFRCPSLLVFRNVFWSFGRKNPKSLDFLFFTTPGLREPIKTLGFWCFSRSTKNTRENQKNNKPHRHQKHLLPFGFWLIFTTPARATKPNQKPSFCFSPEILEKHSGNQKH